MFFFGNYFNSYTFVKSLNDSNNLNKKPLNLSPLGQLIFDHISAMRTIAH